MSLIDSLLLDPYPLNIYIAARTDGVKGSGTINDPWDGSTKDKLDSILGGIAGGTLAQINLGPGNFETRGYADGVTATGWSIKANWKIVGSGMDVTTLKLVDATTADKQYFAIGHALGSTTRADYAEISDLTIDCNLPSGSSVACGAIRVMGDHVRIRRVKAKNWGTRSSVQSVCWVIAAVIADASQSSAPGTSDAGIEDCAVLYIRA